MLFLTRILPRLANRKVVGGLNGDHGQPGVTRSRVTRASRLGIA
jgi:hypothetical protein